MSANNSKNQQASCNILVIHDEHAIAADIKSLLTVNNYQNVMVINGAREAIDLLRQQPIDLLICDIDLKELDGWRITRLIRSDLLRCKSTIPIIATSSTWCERIAEVTAREFGINFLVALNEIERLPRYISASLDHELESSKPSLLVVEDEEDTADLIERILGKRFNIEITSNGESGLDAWIKRRHDLVLLDVMLPKVDGSDVLKKILEIQSTQPIVIMTAHASIEQAIELLIDGAADFISKPFRPEQLREVSEIALRRDDYMVSNEQFAERVRSLAERESAYREVSQVHRHLLNNLQTVVMELDSDFNIIFLNEAWSRIVGYSIQESLNSPFKHFLADQDGRKFRSTLGRFKAVLSGDRQHCEFEICLLNAQAQALWVHLRASLSSRANGDSIGLTVCLEDVSKRKETQRELEYLAMHDSLTGLFNRNYFEMTLKKLSAHTITGKAQHGLIYIDLDYFKVINDTYGHHRGDQILTQLADIIASNIRENDIACRYSGDEFVIILLDVDLTTTYDIAEKLKRDVSEFAFAIGDITINMSCSLGIAMMDENVEAVNEYMIRADVALYVAKHRGRSNVHVYNAEDKESEDLRRNVEWAKKIRYAMKEGRLLLYFQPIMNIKTGEIQYHEALLRMKNANGKIVMPGDFIPALEITGDMALVDRWVIKQAISLLSQHPKLKQVAINLSAQTFQDENLLPIIRDSLEREKIDGSKITFELTESASLLDLTATIKVIEDLHQLGCNFAIDDFGSGFSTFSYLKSLPSDYIKLDGSFVRNLDVDNVDRALVRSIIDVVQALGRKTVAEFVENESVLGFLVENNVDFAQGYYIGRPVPIEEVNFENSIVLNNYT